MARTQRGECRHRRGNLLQEWRRIPEGQDAHRQVQAYLETSAYAA